MNLSRKGVLGGIALAGLLLMVAGPAPASASTPPYTVDASGITLTDGSTFQDNGHVNIEVEGVGQTNFHFESKCVAPQANAGDRPECFQGSITRHDMAQYIGETNIPWSAFGLSGAFCVTWVQISHLNEHFGVDFGTKYCSETDPLCVVDTIHHDEVSHQEYKYSQVIKGSESTTHAEWRFQTRTVTYGEVEHKYIKSTYAFVDGGTTTVNGQVVSGHWVGGQANAWRAIPDSIINAVWGPSGIPANLIGGSEANPKGSVNINVYGGPNVSVQYYAAVEANPSGYTDWGPWSGWSATNPGPATDTMNVESKQVSDNNGTPDKTVYYLPGGGQSDTNTDANWTIQTPNAPWVKFDERKVVDQAAYDENVYGPCPPVEDATAATSVKTAATCLTPSVPDFTIEHATWQEAVDYSVGTHFRTAVAEKGHAFSGNKAEKVVEYTIYPADPSLCPQDASASASADQQATCYDDSTVTFTLAHASWEDPADLSVGTHERWAVADTGHKFDGGADRLKVTYTITAADPSLCPQDASASASADQQATCTAVSTVKLTLVNATVDPSALPLPTTPGKYSVPVTADEHHLFKNGTAHDVVTIEIKDHLSGAVCDKLPVTGSDGQVAIWGVALAALLSGSFLVLVGMGMRRKSQQ